MSVAVNSDACPSPAVWADFLQGIVREPSVDYLSNHLARCSECLAVLTCAEEPRTIPTRCEFVPSPYLREDNFFRLLAWAETLSSIGLASDESHEREGDKLPSQIGRFNVRSVLGVGGFGRVYLAHDPLLNRAVAIKVPHRNRFGTDSDFASFLHEARQVAAFDHKRIVPIYDVLVEQSGRTLVVMKHIKGKSLDDVRRCGTIELKRSVQIMIEVARAAHHAHEQGVVHRDLKPANILIDDNGSPWITDFGLGLCITATDLPFEVHGGTPQYMSPEQVRREIKAIDQRSDIWAMGIMLAELVHGSRPFPQKVRTELFRAITSGQPEIKVTKETAGLDKIVRQCLAKSPDQRFASAEILAERLAEWEYRHFPVGIAKWMYGWRRSTLVFCLCVFATLFVLGNAVFQARQKVNRILSQLEHATPQQVPAVIDSLLSTEIVTTKLSNINWSDIGRWKLDTALIALGDREQSTVSRLCDTLQTAEHDRLSAIVEVITKSDDCGYMVETLSERLTNPSKDSAKTLRLAAALAALAPTAVEWERVADDVCLSLSSLSPRDLRAWTPCFDFPGNHQLRDALERLLQSRNASDETKSAATIALIELNASDDLARTHTKF